MVERTEALIRRWKLLQRNRGEFPAHWDDLSRVMLLRRLGFVTQTQTGDRRATDLFDGTGIQSARALANDIGGRMRPEGQPWSFLRTVEDRDGNTDEAKDWIEDTENRMRDARNDPPARFRQAAGEADLDLVVLGTAVMFVGEALGVRQMVYQTAHLSEASPFFSEAGAVEGVFRSRKMTIRNAVARFGEQKLSEGTRKKFQEKKLDDTIEILFATVPREEGRVDAFLARHLPIADIAIEVEAKHEIAVGGFHEFPYVVPRWDTTAGEDFGRSPGMVALPDVNTSQAIGETMLIAGQRAADPPLLAPSDAFIDAPNTFPGGIAHYEADAVQDLGQNAIRELNTGRGLPFTRDIQQDTRDMIRSAFLRDRFQLPLPGESDMTATEVIARQREFIDQMGAVFGRLETDFTAPMVERQFNVMLRAGAFLPIPEVLQGRSVRFEYESPVKRIRELSESVAATEWVFEGVRLATESQRSDVMDTINVDEYRRFTAEARNIPNKLVRGAEDVAKIRQLRQSQEAAQQQAAELAQGAGIAKDAAKALNEAGLADNTETEQ